MNMLSLTRAKDGIRSHWWFVLIGAVVGIALTVSSDSKEFRQSIRVAAVEAGSSRASNAVFDSDLVPPRPGALEIVRSLETQQFARMLSAAVPAAKAIYASTDDSISVMVRARSAADSRRAIDFVVEEIKTRRTSFAKQALLVVETEKAVESARLERRLESLLKAIRSLPGDSGESKAMVVDYSEIQKSARRLDDRISSFQRSLRLDPSGVAVQPLDSAKGNSGTSALIVFGGIVGAGLGAGVALVAAGLRKRVLTRSDIERATAPGSLVAVVPRSGPIDEFFLDAVSRIHHDGRKIELVCVNSVGSTSAGEFLAAQLPSTSTEHVSVRGVGPAAVSGLERSDVVVLVVDSQMAPTELELRRELLRRTDSGSAVRGVVVVTPTPKDCLRWY